MSNLKWEEWACVRSYLLWAYLPSPTCHVSFPCSPPLDGTPHNFTMFFMATMSLYPIWAASPLFGPGMPNSKPSSRPQWPVKYSNTAVPSSMKLPKNLYRLKERLMKRGFWKSLELSLHSCLSETV
jgi:hypothetical protein